MSISKKIRFEIFKRDEFKCVYCGKSPPSVILEIDHIQPQKDGGKDEINNLLTACFDCNRGKSHIPLDTIPQTLRDNLDVLKEKKMQMREYRKHLDSLNREVETMIDRVQKIFQEVYPDKIFKSQFRSQIRNFIDLLGILETEGSMRIATGKLWHDPDKCIKYFCGVCWRKIKGDARWRQSE